MSNNNSFWEAKYLNSEKSVEFLRQTHAEVLKGLHDEIESLQKQCSDYALRLSLQAPTAIEKEEFDKKFRSFNSEYKKKDALIVEQKKLIDERNRNVKSLEERLKTLERKQEIELAAKDQLLEKLRSQLESQSLQIANLTFQMHHLNKTVAKLNPDQQHTISNNNNTKPLSPRLLKSNRSSIIQTSSSSSSLHNATTAATAAAGKDKIPTDPTIYYSQPKLNNLNYTTQQYHHQQPMNRVKISIENIEAALESVASASASTQHSGSNSARTDRSLASPTVVATIATTTTTTAKNLPPVIIGSKASSQNNPPSQHHTSSSHRAIIVTETGGESSTPITTTNGGKPFLNSTPITLHSRSKRDLLQRRTLITLPPIKPFEINQLAVESPLKMAHHQNVTVGGGGSGAGASAANNTSINNEKNTNI